MRHVNGASAFGVRSSNAVLNRAFSSAGMLNVNVNAPFGSGERRSNALAERNRPISTHIGCCKYICL